MKYPSIRLSNTATEYRRLTVASPEVGTPGWLDLKHLPDGNRLLPKTHSASEVPRSLDLVRWAFKEAVAIQNAWTRFRGVASVFGLGLVGSSMALVLEVIPFFVNAMVVTVEEGDYLFAGIFFLISLVFSLICLVATTSAIRVFRVELFSPKEIPLVFNRKTRKVYRFIPDVPAFPSSRNLKEGIETLPKIPRYWLSAFLPWPKMLLVEYDWDCLEAGIVKTTQLWNNVVRTVHAFQFYVKAAPDSTEIVSAFTAAPPMFTGEKMILDFWEHIRRYMEEDGPALSPGDKPAPPYPNSLLEAANTVIPKYGWLLFLIGGPFAVWAAFFRYPQPDNPFSTIPSIAPEYGATATIALFATMLVSFLALATIFFNWLAHKFGKDLVLPAELFEQAGPELDLNELAQQAKLAKANINAKTAEGTIPAQPKEPPFRPLKKSAKR